MAQQALTAGTIPSKRALFGLLDADGWTWAGIKAFIWLVIITLMLAYIPDRAYYFTVNRTVELGLLAWSPVNLCPPGNESLPCPAPVGAIVPWHPSPEQLALPAPRTDGSLVQSGNTMLYIGGSDGQTAQATVYAAPVVPQGNFDEWQEGPALPAPRTDATVLNVAGSVYVFGGRDETGAPTTSVFVLTPDVQTGALGEWQEAEDLVLPTPVAGAAAAAAPTGIYLVGGEGADGPLTNVWLAENDDNGELQPWIDQAPLLRPQADGIAAVVGDYVWLWSGHDANGAVGAVQRGAIGLAAEEGQPENPDEGLVTQWAVSDAANLPIALDRAAGWAANGALYVVGGANADGLQGDLYWTTPTSSGDITEWKHLEQSDLPFGLAGSSAALNGPNIILTGGETTDGVIRGSARANTAPESPFFQLGLVGATVPGLKIEGEIGQQLGYLNAAGAGTVNFIILLLVGWAFAHQDQARSIIRRALRR
jgi:hypothetical protein